MDCVVEGWYFNTNFNRKEHVSEPEDSWDLDSMYTVG